MKKTIVYPNPVNEILNIESIAEIQEIKIFDSKGILKKLYEYENRSIHISELNAGLYYIEVKYKDKVEILKFIKI